MPSGYGNASSVDGGSEALQAAFLRGFRSVLAEAAAPPSSRELRAASLFQLVDDADCAAEAAYYNGSAAPAFVEYLCTLGLARANGTAKPAFEAFLDTYL